MTSTARPPDAPARSGDRRRTVARRAILTLAVLLAIGIFVLAGRLAESGDDEGVTVSGDIVERLVPAENDEVFQQSRIAVDLATGWGLESLVVNGQPIPEPEWQVTSELALYEFVPGDGKTVETLQADQNDIVATVFQLRDPTNTRTVRWQFTAF